MLTQLTTVKSRLALTDTTYDTLLTNFIKHASGRFDAQCNRRLARQAGATDEFGAQRTELPLMHYPVETIIKFELKASEADGWQEVTGVDYLLRLQCIIALPVPLGTRQELLRITYDGGYVLPGNTPATGQTALSDELEQACVEQVAYWFQSRERLGIITSMQQGVAFYQFSQLDLLEHVKAMFLAYRRWEL